MTTGKILTLGAHYHGFCDMICRGCGAPSDTIRCKECWDKLYEETTRPFSSMPREAPEEEGTASSDVEGEAAGDEQEEGGGQA